MTRRFSASTSAPSWSTSHGRLSRPTPCSPVIVPPSAIAEVHDLAVRRAAPGRPGPGRRGRRRSAGGCCRRPRARSRRSSRRRPRRSPAMPSTSAPSRGSGTPTSSSSRVPVRSTAGIALRRATTKASPSSGSSVAKTSVAPCSSQIPAIVGDLGGGVARRLVGLDDQHRGGLAVQAHLRHVLDRVDGRPVHELQHRGPHPAGDGEDGGGRVVEGRERRDERGRRPLARGSAAARPR